MRTGHCTGGLHDGCPAPLACFCLCHGDQPDRAHALRCTWCGRATPADDSPFCSRACSLAFRSSPEPPLPATINDPREGIRVEGAGSISFGWTEQRRDLLSWVDA